MLWSVASYLAPAKNLKDICDLLRARSVSSDKVNIERLNMLTISTAASKKRNKIVTIKI